MTVLELKKLLTNKEDDRLVILASDGEGNIYSPLYNVYTGVYKSETPYSGVVGLEKLTKIDKVQGYTKEDIIEGQPALILVPLN